MGSSRTEGIKETVSLFKRRSGRARKQHASAQAKGHARALEQRLEPRGKRRAKKKQTQKKRCGGGGGAFMEQNESPNDGDD